MIIGSEQLARLQFQYEGDRPPFLFATTAEEALLLCQRLVAESMSGEERGLNQRNCDVGSAGGTALDDLRWKITEWYIRVYQNINNRVQYTLESLG